MIYVRRSLCCEKMEPAYGGSGVNRDNCPDLSHSRDELPQFDIKEAASTCAGMSLNTLKVGDYIVVTNSQFDVVVSEEPYVALMLLVSLKSGRFFARVWNQTISMGKALTVEELAAACRNLFRQGRPCLGKLQGELQGEESEVFISYTPFQRIVSRNCQKFLGVHATDGSNSCRECTRLNDIGVDSEIKGENIDIDVKAVPEGMATGLVKEEVNEVEVAPHNEHLRDVGSSQNGNFSFMMNDKYMCNRCSDFPCYFTTFKDLCNHLLEAHKNEEYANEISTEQISSKIASDTLPQINANKRVTELPPITDPWSQSNEKSKRRARNKKNCKKANRTYKCMHCSFVTSDVCFVREHISKAHPHLGVEQGGSTMKHKCNRCSDFPNYFSTFKDLCNHLQEAHNSDDTERNTESEDTVIIHHKT